MMSIAENIKSIQTSILEDVTLVAVSKFHPKESIQEAYNAGQRAFAESRVQELLQKRELLPQDIEWHFIGHLQTNKIKPILPFVSLIHGIDSLHLLEAVEKEAAKQERITSVLLQVYIADEQTKFGFSADEILSLSWEHLHQLYPHIRVKGLMGMASFTENRMQIKQEMASLKLLFDQIKKKQGDILPDFQILSMGMSSDYDIALQEGSTMIRLGSSIFGNRY